MIKVHVGYINGQYFARLLDDEEVIKYNKPGDWYGCIVDIPESKAVEWEAFLDKQQEWNAFWKKQYNQYYDELGNHPNKD